MRDRKNSECILLCAPIYDYVYKFYRFNDKYALMDQFQQNFRSFHPKDPAYGTLNYDIGALNKYQKEKLNLRKTKDRYENEVYLRMHPEIKGLITILLRHVLHAQPYMHVHETIGEFFNRPRHQIQTDLLEYQLRAEQTTNVETESVDDI